MSCGPTADRTRYLKSWLPGCKVPTRGISWCHTSCCKVSFRLYTSKHEVPPQLTQSALGLMPLQLLNLGPLFTIGWARGFSTKTPRGMLELLFSSTSRSLDCERALCHGRRTSRADRQTMPLQMRLRSSTTAGCTRRLYWFSPSRWCIASSRR